MIPTTHEDHEILKAMLDEHGAARLLELIAELLDECAEENGDEDCADAAEAVSQAAREVDGILGED